MTDDYASYLAELNPAERAAALRARRNFWISYFAGLFVVLAVCGGLGLL